MIEMKPNLIIMLLLVTVFGLLLAPQIAAQGSATPNAISAAKAEPQAAAQTVSSSSAVIPALPVPRLVKYSGVVKDVKGQAVTGIVGLSFSLYAEQEGGSALWMETQNAELDKQGRYTVLLGSTKSEGVPLDLFASGEPRWLGVKVELQGEVEQARVLLVSVPYALKASDADTLGGKPASAFVLHQGETTTTGGGTTASSTISSSGIKNVKPAASGNAETADYLAMFTNSNGAMGNSALYQNASGNIGLGYTNPTNARLVIAAPSGGGVLNSSNLSDQDMFVTLSAPGASDKHAYFGPSTATNLTLGVGNTEMMRITNTGNVGIGYSNPTNARLVIGAPKGGGVLNASNLADQDMFVSLSAPGASDKHAFFGPSTNTNLTLGVGNTEMMRITSAGNVGIGTSTPGATLEVDGGGTYGVYASSSNSSGAGLYGTSPYYGVYGNGSGGSGAGVVGASSYYGVYGVGSTIGVYGASTAGLAMEAVTTANANAFKAQNDSNVVNNLSNPTIVGHNNGNGALFYADNYNGYFCEMDQHGNFGCSGSKSAIVPVDGGSRQVALYAIEAPQNWFEDFGSGQLSNGSAVVNLEPVFAQTVNPQLDYHVFLTPNGECKGLYVSQKSAASFEVHELGGGNSNVKFDYRIVALRKNYENLRLEDHTAKAQWQRNMAQHSSPSLEIKGTPASVTAPSAMKVNSTNKLKK